MVLRAATHGTTHHEHCREDFHWSQSCRTHPEKIRYACRIESSHHLVQSRITGLQENIVAQAHQLQFDRHLLVEYDPSITEYSVSVHSYGNKLLPKHRGPFQVMDKTDSIYTIEDLVAGKRITTHIHNLRPFIYDPIRTERRIVAQHNEQGFIVESILGHRGNRNRRSTFTI